MERLLFVKTLNPYFIGSRGAYNQWTRKPPMGYVFFCVIVCQNYVCRCPSFYAAADMKTFVLCSFITTTRFFQVRFDETTITRAAELGESAARFRQIARDKRQRHNQLQNSPPQVSFGISKSISIWHDETLDNRTDSPTLNNLSQSPPEPNRSIFHLNSIQTYSGLSYSSSSNS